MLDRLRAWLARLRSRPGTPLGQDDFKLLADNSLDLIVRCDRNQITTYASPSSLAILGVEPHELVGRPHLERVHPDDRAMLADVVARHHAGQREARASFRMVRKDGSFVWVEGSGRMVDDPATGLPNFVVVMRDITERRAREASLEALALTDPLTGLANRRAFDDTLATEWLRTRRDGTTLSLLLLDVDCFKAFNDHYGHQTGDDCLRAVAAAVGATLRRPGDLAARYGGEEMAVILPQTEGADAARLAESLRAAVEAVRIPHQTTTAAVKLVTVSVGCATTISRVGASIQMPAALLRTADSALYRAKAAGRNRVETALILNSSD